MAVPIPGSLEMKIDLPERVLDFTSTNMPEPEIVLDYLPQRHELCASGIYTAPDGFRVHGDYYFDGRGPDEHPQAGLLPAGAGLAH